MANKKEFTLGQWFSDGSGAPCPSCKGLGTQKPTTPNFKTKKGREHVLGVVDNPPYGVMTASGAYGPACPNCEGSGKVYE